MTNPKLQAIKKYPAFPLLLPVFFVLHGFRENFGLISVADALLLLATYLVAALLLLLLFKWLFGQWTKAAIAGFITLGIHFFFGAVQDWLRSNFPGTLITKYVFLVPLLLLFLLTILYWLWRTKRRFFRSKLYLNTVMLLLIIMEIVILVSRAATQKPPVTEHSFKICNECPKPDIYIIIADEYPGNKELKEIFSFDNSTFIRELQSLGFHHIPVTSSNYNLTPYSIASTLDMDYLKWENTRPPLSQAYEVIKTNRFVQFALTHGYEFYNQSFFDVADQPTPTVETFLPAKTRLITGQTLLSRLDKEISYHLITTLKWKKRIRRSVYYNRKNNENISNSIKDIADKKTDRPKLVLAHLMMPHYPYYFDKDGREQPFETLTEGNQQNYENFIGYLQHSNKKYLELLSSIIRNSKQPPLVVLLSDHGFRHFRKPEDRKHYFSNFIAVHLPNKKYDTLPDSLSNVNALRTILNMEFKQQLPVLKDTTFIMDNP